jgi:hypothetical protein
MAIPEMMTAMAIPEINKIVDFLFIDILSTRFDFGQLTY